MASDSWQTDKVRQPGKATRRIAAVTVGVLSIATAAAGTAVAVSSARWNPVWKGGTIHQCLDNKTWVTRTLPRGKKCSSHETSFVFNQSGPRGPKGAAGSAGLGASAFSDDDAITPPNTGTATVIKQVTITTTRPGKLLILDAAVEAASFNNTSAEPVVYRSGVYVDGVGVPGTGSVSEIQVPAESGPDTIDPFSVGPGSISGIAAGTHTVTLELRTTDTSVNYLTSGAGRLLVVATG
jgi:hypothetical protein